VLQGIALEIPHHPCDSQHNSLVLWNTNLCAGHSDEEQATLLEGRERRGAGWGRECENEEPSDEVWVHLQWLQKWHLLLWSCDLVQESASDYDHCDILCGVSRNPGSTFFFGAHSQHGLPTFKEAIFDTHFEQNGIAFIVCFNYYVVLRDVLYNGAALWLLLEQRSSMDFPNLAFLAQFLFFLLLDVFHSLWDIKSCEQEKPKALLYFEFGNMWLWTIQVEICWRTCHYWSPIK